MTYHLASRAVWLSAVLWLVPACSSTHVQLGSDDTRVRCGTAVCDADEVCCNESCGICTPPGAGCVQVTCEPDAGTACGGEACGRGDRCCTDCDGRSFCSSDVCPDLDECPADPPYERCDEDNDCGSGAQCCPSCDGGFCFGGDPCPRPACPFHCAAMDARGEGPCDAAFGFAWDGAACAPLSGCECVGTDCGRTFESAEACAAAYRECETDCAPQDAYGQGPCDAFFGYAWSGSSCVSISGCECVGDDCDAIYESEEACLAAHDACARTCGGLLGEVCPDSDWCDFPDEELRCGVADGQGVCRPRPDACPRIEAPVCGCDGQTYSNECLAHGAGVDVLSEGACDR